MSLKAYLRYRIILKLYDHEEYGAMIWVILEALLACVVDLVATSRLLM